MRLGTGNAWLRKVLTLALATRQQVRRALMKGRKSGGKGVSLKSARSGKVKEPVTNERVAESLRYLNKDAFRPRTKR